VIIVKTNFVPTAYRKESAMLAAKEWKKKSRRNAKSRRRDLKNCPSLRFTPTSWAKLVYLRDLGDVEIGGFGISAAADPLLIEDIVLIRQRCTPVTVAFDDVAIADFFDEQVDAGLQPERFSRVWIHSHPGCSPLPSSVDEATFDRVFGTFAWSVMAIVARNDAAYARLQYRVGPGGAWEIPVAVDYSRPFAGSDHEAWNRRYDECVRVDPAFDVWLDEGQTQKERPDDWPFSLEEWKEHADGTLNSGSVRSTERPSSPG